MSLVYLTAIIAMLCGLAAGSAPFRGLPAGASYTDWSPPASSVGISYTNDTISTSVVTPAGLVVAAYSLNVGYRLVLIPWDGSGPAPGMVRITPPQYSIDGMAVDAAGRVFVSAHGGSDGEVFVTGVATDAKKGILFLWSKSFVPGSGVPISYFVSVTFDVDAGNVLLANNTHVAVIDGATGATQKASPAVGGGINLLSGGGVMVCKELYVASGAVLSQAGVTMHLVGWEKNTLAPVFSTAVDASGLASDESFGSFTCGSSEPVVYGVVSKCPPFSETCELSRYAVFDAAVASSAAAGARTYLSPSTTYLDLTLISTAGADYLLAEKQPFLIKQNELQLLTSSGSTMWTTHVSQSTYFREFLQAGFELVLGVGLKPIGVVISLNNGAQSSWGTLEVPTGFSSQGFTLVMGSSPPAPWIVALGTLNGDGSWVALADRLVT